MVFRPVPISDGSTSDAPICARTDMAESRTTPATQYPNNTMRFLAASNIGLKLSFSFMAKAKRGFFPREDVRQYISKTSPLVARNYTPNGISCGTIGRLIGGAEGW